MSLAKAVTTHRKRRRRIRKRILKRTRVANAIKEGEVTKKKNINTKDPNKKNLLLPQGVNHLNLHNLNPHLHLVMQVNWLIQLPK